MRGGPFVELPEQAAEDAAKMLERDKKLLAPTLKGGKDLQAVQKPSAGCPRIARAALRAVAPSLAGLVELVYGESAAYVRFFEALTYQSELHRPEAQSSSLGALPEARPFVMSTPRLPNRDRWSSCPLRRAAHRSPLLVPARLGGRADEPRPKPRKDRCSRSARGGCSSARPSRSAETPPWTSKDVRVTTVGHASERPESGDPPRIPWSRGRPRGPHDVRRAAGAHRHRGGDPLASRSSDLETLIRLRGRVGAWSSRSKAARRSILDGRDAAPTRLQRRRRDLGLRHCPGRRRRGHGAPLPRRAWRLDVRGKAGFYVHFGGKARVRRRLEEPRSGALPTAAAHRPLDEFFIGMECEGASFLWAYGSFLASRVAIADGESRRLNASTKTKGSTSCAPRPASTSTMGPSLLLPLRQGVRRGLGADAARADS